MRAAAADVLWFEPPDPRASSGHGDGHWSGGGLVSAIRAYQRRISSRRPPVCRFTPSCSEYTAQALLTHGTWRGLRLGAGRLLRCRPGGARGADPVPTVSAAA
jgi:uncharacterized protein